MKAAEGQKHEVSELDLQLGMSESQVFRHEGRTGGHGEVGWLGGGD